MLIFVLDLLLFNDDGKLKCQVYDKIYYFHFAIDNYPFMINWLIGFYSHKVKYMKIWIVTFQ